MPTNNTSRSKPPFQVFLHSKFCDSWCNWIMKNWNEYVAWRWIQSFFEVFFMLFFSFLLFKFFLVCRFYVSLFGFSVCFFLSTRSIKKTRSSMLTIVLWNIITQLWPFTLLMSLRQIRQWIYINLFLLIPYCINFFSLQRSSTWQGTIKFGIWRFW
jgi:hypothetical protein